MQGVETILAQAHRTLLKSMGVPITYEHGNSNVDLTALVGSTVFRLDSAESAGTIRLVTRDYLILTQNLQINAQVIEPARGDRILETRNGVTFIHGVLALGNEPGWRWSDPYRVVLRVHTKLIEQEPS